MIFQMNETNACFFAGPTDKFEIIIALRETLLPLGKNLKTFVKKTMFLFLNLGSELNNRNSQLSCHND